MSAACVAGVSHIPNERTGVPTLAWRRFLGNLVEMCNVEILTMGYWYRHTCRPTHNTTVAIIAAARLTMSESHGIVARTNYQCTRATDNATTVQPAYHYLITS